MDKKVQEFRDSIFVLNPRQFGTIAERMIEQLYDLDEPDSLAFDKKDNESNKRIEIKFSRVMKKNDVNIQNNIIAQSINANPINKAMNSSDVTIYNFDCNIQQVKCNEFDILYYGLFFADCIVIFKITSEKIPYCPSYSDKQHRGNKGEGQFHINKANFTYHYINYYEKTLTYEELYSILNNLEQ